MAARPASIYARPDPGPTRLAYRVSAFGRERCQPYHSAAGTYHDEVMLNVILSGRGRFSKQDQVTPVRAGMVGLMVTQGEKDPGLLTADPGDPYDLIYCRFSGGEARPLAERIASRHGGRVYNEIACWQQVAEVLQRGLAVGMVLCMPRLLDEPIRQDAALAEALAIMNAESAGSVHANTLSKDRLRLYMQDHITEPTSVELVAAHFGVSRSHLSRVAHELLGMPLHQYWTRLKMEWAQTLLREPCFSIQEVAQRVGFHDPFHFSKRFKQVTGRSPQAWRRQHGDD